jgi:hypothetical protein
MSFGAPSQARVFCMYHALFFIRLVFKDLISPLPCSHWRRLRYQRLIGAGSVARDPTVPHRESREGVGQSRSELCRKGGQITAIQTK